MTPEERAVIDAAIELYEESDERRGSRIANLEGCVSALYVSRRPPPQVWMPATFGDCLAGDQLRLGTDQATVIRSHRGQWHADVADPYRPQPWEHEEIRLELDVIPGKFLQYPLSGPVEILMDAERAATHLFQQQFPGTTKIGASRE